MNIKIATSAGVIESQLSCFVICPIGNKHAEAGELARELWENSIQAWEEIISPACIGAGLSALRADQINEAGEITDQIFRRLRDSHVVIADLTGANPNVMYELGLRHTTGKLTIQIGELDRLPFDINTIRTVIFKRTPLGLIEARRRLTELLIAGIQGNFSQLSATRVWFELNQPIAEVESAVPEEDHEEEPGFLEALADMNAAMADTSATISAIGNVIQEIGSATLEATEALKASNGAADFRIGIRISNDLAKKIEDPAGRLSILTNDLLESIRRSDIGTRFQIDNLLSNESEENKEALSQLLQLFKSMMRSFESAEDYRRGFLGRSPTRAQGVQYRRIASAIETQLLARPIVGAWVGMIERNEEAEAEETKSLDQSAIS